MACKYPQEVFIAEDDENLYASRKEDIISIGEYGVYTLSRIVNVKITTVEEPTTNG